MSRPSIRPSAVSRVLGTVAAILVIASLSGLLSKVVPGFDEPGGLVLLFDVNEERNVPTYFATALLLIAAGLLAVLAVLDRPAHPSVRSKWMWLSAGFAFLAYDEAFRVHEALGVHVRAGLGNRTLGPFHFAWVIPGILGVLVVTAIFFRFVMTRPDAIRRRFVLAGALYVGGALGFEMIGGWYLELFRRRDLVYGLMATVEESLEMAGVIVFIHALLEVLVTVVRERRAVDPVSRKATGGQTTEPAG